MFQVLGSATITLVVLQGFVWDVGEAVLGVESAAMEVGAAVRER